MNRKKMINNSYLALSMGAILLFNEFCVLKNLGMK